MSDRKRQQVVQLIEEIEAMGATRKAGKPQDSAEAPPAG